MSNARNLARLIVDSGGDVEVSSLGNVPPSNDASALTTGTLPVARIADGDVTAAKLASTLDLSGKTVTLPAGTGGGVLQVAQTVSSSRISLNTYTDTLLLSCTITPTLSTSKIMININLAVGDTDDWGFMLKRNGTVIKNHGYSSSYSDPNCFASGDQFDMGIYEHYNLSWIFIDAPATTSSATYEIWWNPQGGNTGVLFLNRDSGGSGQGQSMLTLTELSGAVA